MKNRVESKKAILAIRDFNVGGWGTYTENLRKLLEELGYSVSIFSESNKGLLLDSFTKESESTIVVKRGILSRSSYIRKVTKKVKKMGVFDLMINISSEVANDVFVMTNINGIRISTVHSVFEYEIRNAIACIEPLTKVICVSNNVKDHALKIFPEIDKNCLSIIPPMVNVEVSNCKSPAENRRDPYGDNMEIVYVGRVTTLAKRVDLLPEICVRLNEMKIPFQLHIIGDGDYKKRLYESFLSAGLQKNVTFYGPLSPNEIFCKLSSMHALLLPSENEGLPHCIIEAMSMGVVPIATRINGSTDVIIKDGQDGYLVDFEDVDGFAYRVYRLYKEKRLFGLLSGMAVNKYNVEFSKDKVKELWENEISILGHENLIKDLNAWPIRPKKISDIFIIGGVWRYFRRLKVS
jgi:glycosyltransferase involved in cell wall biosynthesis